MAKRINPICTLWWVKVLFLTSFVYLINTNLWAKNNILVMGYRTTEKLPFIAAAPNNEGIFKDLYTEAARRMGYELQIVRLPKLRIMKSLKSGQIDFYPTLTFDEDREKFVHFARNGLQVKFYVIVRSGLKDLQSSKDLKETVQLRSLGSPDFLGAIGLRFSDVKVREITEMDTSKAIKMLQAKRGDFYIYEAEVIEHDLKKSNPGGVKIYRNLSMRTEWALIGFSKKSQLYKAETNPYYNKSSPLAYNNLPYLLAINSPLKTLEETLENMRKEGFIDQLLKKYLK